MIIQSTINHEGDNVHVGVVIHANGHAKAYSWSGSHEKFIELMLDLMFDIDVIDQRMTSFGS